MKKSISKIMNGIIIALCNFSAYGAAGQLVHRPPTIQGPVRFVSQDMHPEAFNVGFNCFKKDLVTMNGPQSRLINAVYRQMHSLLALGATELKRQQPELWSEAFRLHQRILEFIQYDDRVMRYVRTPYKRSHSMATRKLGLTLFQNCYHTRALKLISKATVPRCCRVHASRDIESRMKELKPILLAMYGFNFDAQRARDSWAFDSLYRNIHFYWDDSSSEEDECLFSSDTDSNADALLHSTPQENSGL